MDDLITTLVEGYQKNNHIKVDILKMDSWEPSFVFPVNQIFIVELCGKEEYKLEDGTTVLGGVVLNQGGEKVTGPFIYGNVICLPFPLQKPANLLKLLNEITPIWSALWGETRDLRVASFIKNNVNSDEKKLNEKIKKLNKKINVYNESIKTVLKEREEAERALKNASLVMSKMRESVSECFELLDKHEGVDKWWINNDKIWFTTNEICIEHDGKEYFFGPFKLSLKLDGTLKCWHALSEQHNTRLHPHINDHSVCLGNMMPVLVKSLANMNLYSAISAILSVLSSYNKHDAYFQIESYKEQDERNGADYYKECLLTANPLLDCVKLCTKTQCPFSETKFDRCMEKIENEKAWTTCISCRKCKFWKKAEKNIKATTVRKETTTSQKGVSNSKDCDVVEDLHDDVGNDRTASGGGVERFSSCDASS